MPRSLFRQSHQIQSPDHHPQHNFYMVVMFNKFNTDITWCGFS